MMKERYYVGSVTNGCAWLYPHLLSHELTLFFGCEEFGLYACVSTVEDLPVTSVQVDQFRAEAIRISCHDDAPVLWEYRPGDGIFRIWRAGKTGLYITWEPWEGA